MRDTLDPSVRDDVLAFVRNDRCAKSLGIDVVEIGPGHVTVTMKVGPDMLNAHGTCHGGIIYTLADAAFAFASNAHGQRAVAQFCSIAYLRPAGLGAELRAVATESILSGQRGVYDIAVRCGDDVVAAFRGHARTLNGPGGG